MTMHLLALLASFLLLCCAQTPCGGHSVFPPPGICRPAPQLPVSDALPAFSRDHDLVLTVGSRGIAGATAELAYAQGAAVVATTVEANAQKRAQLGLVPGAQFTDPVDLMELDLGLDGTNSPKSPERFVYRFMDRYQGCLPTIIGVIGQNVNSGNPEDYTTAERLYNTNMYQNGWMTLLTEFQKFNQFPCNVNRTVKVVFMLSAGAESITPGVLLQYYNGHQAKLNYIRNQGIQQQVGMANWERMGVMGTFVNTTYFLSQRNPSADRGDTAQQQYLDFTIRMTLAVGNSPQEAALALLQAATLRTRLNGTQLFQLLPGQLPNTTYTDWSTNSFGSLQTYSQLAWGVPTAPQYYLMSAGGMASKFQIFVTQHANYTYPFYTPQGREWRKRAQ